MENLLGRAWQVSVLSTSDTALPRSLLIANRRRTWPQNDCYKNNSHTTSKHTFVNNVSGWVHSIQTLENEPGIRSNPHGNLKGIRPSNNLIETYPHTTGKTTLKQPQNNTQTNPHIFNLKSITLKQP